MTRSGNTRERQRSTKPRGFAAMSPEQRRAFAARGGKKVHEMGVAHRFTPEEAKLAGTKGGQATSKDREHMAAIGKKGGGAPRRITARQAA